MAEHSTIEWTDATWNPITGCSVVSPGCTNCYAMGLAGTRLKHHPSRQGLTRDTKAGPVWTSEVRLNEDWLDQPLRWKRPRRIFVCAHGDLFHESVPDEWIDRVFAAMALAPQHTFQVLTKRAERMRKYFAGSLPGDGVAARIMDATWRLAPTRVHLPMIAPPPIIEVPVGPRKADGEPEFGWRRFLGLDRWPLPNVWLGVSVEDQRRAEERIPHLLATPAAVRFISAEPLLGPVDLHSARCQETGSCPACPQCLGGLDWVIAGGESGPGARAAAPQWFRSLRDQCAAAGVPYFFKQWGEWGPSEHPTHWIGPAGIRPAGSGVWSTDDGISRVGKKAAGAMLDGREHREMPS